MTRAAKDQEGRLRADLREVQRKLEAEQRYAEKVREEREELRQVIKRQKVWLDNMDAKVKTLEAEAAKESEDLRIQVTDAIQRAVERCTRKYLDNLDSCFPGATYIFSPDEDDPLADTHQGKAASQDSQNNAKRKMEHVDSVAADDEVSVSSKT